VLGDKHDNLVHLFERDCSVQRRNKKMVERAPAPYMDEVTRSALCEPALRFACAVNYSHAGTVEHTVTEVVTGVDIVKAQIRVTEGARAGSDDSLIPRQEDISLCGHALQCRRP